VAQVIFLFAGPLVNDIIAPELPPDAQRLAVNLTRLLLLSPLLLGLGAAAKGMLEAHDAFTLPAIAPILYNLGIILGAIALTPWIGVYGLAAGVILGAASHVAIQFAALLRYGFRVRPSLSRETEGLAEVVRLMLPRIAGQVAGQANLIVMTNFASRLGEGRIAALNYAQHLVLLPHGILAMSLSTVIFPRLARQFELGKVDEFRQTMYRALGPLVFLTVPAAIGLFTFRVSIVQIVLQYGSFTAESTALVADAVGYFALGLLARALIEPITRAFYAMRDTRTPLVVALLAIVVNIAGSAILAPRLGHGGLALSISITSTLRMLALLTILSRRTGGLGDILGPSLMRMLPALAIMAVVANGMESVLRPITDPVNGRSVWSYVLFVLSLAGAGAVFLVVAYLFRIPELFQFVQAMQHRMGRRR
jgi:putative peptidoglycan lipid II flippase